MIASLPSVGTRVRHPAFGPGEVRGVAGNSFWELTIMFDGESRVRRVLWMFAKEKMSIITPNVTEDTQP